VTLFILGTDIAYPQRIASGGLIKRVSDGKELADIRDMGFVAIKATQGTNIVDAQWVNSYAMARKFGKKVLAYHFNDNRVSIPAQADKFLATAQFADYLFLDQEGDFGFSDAQAQAFIDHVRSKGRKCGLYHSASGFAGVNADSEWVADYRLDSLQDADTTVPGWDMWQFSSEGGPDGAGLDLDYMRADSPLAAALGLNVVTQAQLDAANTATAAMAKLKDEALADVVALQAAAQADDATIAELQDKLLAAPGAERERIAQAEADRIRLT
jgi:hypothetical protein